MLERSLWAGYAPAMSTDPTHANPALPSDPAAPAAPASDDDWAAMALGGASAEPHTEEVLQGAIPARGAAQLSGAAPGPSTEGSAATSGAAPDAAPPVHPKADRDVDRTGGAAATEPAPPEAADPDGGAPGEADDEQAALDAIDHRVDGSDDERSDDGRDDDDHDDDRRDDDRSDDDHGDDDDDAHGAPDRPSEALSEELAAADAPPPGTAPSAPAAAEGEAHPSEPPSAGSSAAPPPARRRSGPPPAPLLGQPDPDAARSSPAELASVHVDDPCLDSPEGLADLVRWLSDPRPAPWAVVGAPGSGRSHLAQMIRWQARHLGLPVPQVIEQNTLSQADLAAMPTRVAQRSGPVVLVIDEQADPSALGLPPSHRSLRPAPWTLERARRLLVHTARGLERPGLVAWDERWPGGLDALHAALGAGPRTTHAIIAALLRCRPEATPEAVLLLHLRAVAPALQVTLAGLAGQPQQILRALAGPTQLTAAEIAEVTQLDVNSVSSQLHRLRASGLVSRREGGRGASPHLIADRAAAAALAIEAQGPAAQRALDSFDLLYLTRVPASAGVGESTAPLRRRLLERVRPTGLTPPLPPALSLLGRPDATAAALPRPTRLRALRALAEAIRDMPGAWPAGWDNRAAWEAVGGAWVRLQRKEELVRELALLDTHGRARLLQSLRTVTQALALLHGEDAVRAIGTALRSGDLAHPADAGSAAAAAERLQAPSLSRAVALNAAAGWPEPPALRALFDQLVQEEPHAGSWLLWTALAVPPSLAELRHEGARRAWAAAGPDPAFATLWAALALPAEAPLVGADDLIEKILERDPDHVAALTLRGEARWRAGARAQAERAWAAASERIETTPGPTEAVRRLTEAAGALLGRGAEADRASRALAASHAWPYARLAELCAVTPGRSDEAARHARRALTLYPEAAGPRLLLAGAAPEEASRWLQPLLSQPEARFVSLLCPPGAAPGPSPALCLGLEALMAMRSEDDHLRAMMPHIDPRQAPGVGAHPYQRLARALASPPDREAAAALVRERPEDALLWSLLAQAQDQLHEDAEAAWRRAAALDPDEPLALAGLAGALGQKAAQAAKGEDALHSAALEAEINALHLRLATLGPAGPAGRVEAAARAAARGLLPVAAEEALRVLGDRRLEPSTRGAALQLLRRLMREGGAVAVFSALGQRPGQLAALRAAAEALTTGRPERCAAEAPEVEAVSRSLLEP
jgi:DNA-binding transcriptional ArsR family regulator